MKQPQQLVRMTAERWRVLADLLEIAGANEPEILVFRASEKIARSFQSLRELERVVRLSKDRKPRLTDPDVPDV